MRFRLERCLRIAVLSVWVCTLSAVGSVQGDEVDDGAVPDRPHIVLIMADDMGFSDIGCYGGEIATPNLDRLAEEGMRFTQFYNNAKCTTTRASLLTGLYPRKGGRGLELLDDRMITLGEALGRAGYRTIMTGKWHLGSRAPHRPIDRGFDFYYGLMDGCCNFFDPSRPDPDFKGGRVRVFGVNDQRITTFPDDFYTTDAFTDAAIEQLRADHRDAPDQPKFLHITYTAPHYPLHAKAEDIARYRGRYLDGWDQLRQQRYERQVAMGLIDPSWELPPRDPEADPWVDAPYQNWQDLRMAVYAAMIDSMDQNIGRLLATLDELDMAENTMVLFLSDNGGCAETPGGEDPQQIPGEIDSYTHCGPGWAYAQNTPFRRFKQWVHEGGISTPLIAHWPGRIAPGAQTDQVSHIIDVMPTLLDVAGESYPETLEGRAIRPVEGRSLRTVLEGGALLDDRTLAWHWAGNRAIRQGDWKLAWDRKREVWELYDLKRDRTEMHDLADQYPERVEQFSAGWHAWARRTGIE